MADSEECQRDLERDMGVEEGAPEDTQRLTAQWSVEDEEEAARERRRRERERQLRSQAEEGLNAGTSAENGESVQESQFDGKSSGTSELEEDEGFSDWSQKLEQRKQRCAGEGVQEGERTCQWTEAQQAGYTQQEERALRHSYGEEDSIVREVEVELEQVHLDQVSDSPAVIRFGCRPSNFLKFVPASPSFDQSETEAELEGQQKLSEAVDIREVREPTGAGEEDEDVEQEHECEEEQKQEEQQRRRNEEEGAPWKRQRAPSISSLEEEYQPPLSPTIKITDITESLNRSIERSNSVKKTQTLLPSKIDDRLEQYTHAIESSSKIPKPARQLSIDLPTNSAVVASTKSLWETGEVSSNSPVRTTSSKDIVAGDIVNKRSIWEQKETTKADESAKVKLPGKKYKYVATGHGQYKKVLIDDEGTAK